MVYDGFVMQRPIAVISHERSGTHLTLDTLRNFFKETSTRQLPFTSPQSLYFNLDWKLAREAEQTMEQIERLSSRPLLKTHMLPDLSTVWKEEAKPLFRDLLDQSDHVYVLRDGRDVMVSFYYYRQSFEDYNGTFEGTFSEFLERGNGDDKPPPPVSWAEHVRAWTGQPGVTVVKYEQMLSEFPQVLERMRERLAIRRNRRPPEPVKLTKSRLARAVQRMLGTQDSSAVQPRKGKVGDWRNHFSEEDKAYFKQAAGDVLIEWGYETDNDW